MNKKLILILFAVFVLLIVGGVFLYKFLQNRSVENNKQINQDNFSLTYSYKGNSLWEYTVAGTLPTPCYQVTTDAIVMESYPEQVKVTVHVETDPSTDLCIAVIQNYTYSGTFNASNKATVSLVVE